MEQKSNFRLKLKLKLGRFIAYHTCLILVTSMDSSRERSEKHDFTFFIFSWFFSFIMITYISMTQWSEQSLEHHEFDNESFSIGRMSQTMFLTVLHSQNVNIQSTSAQFSHFLLFWPMQHIAICDGENAQKSYKHEILLFTSLPRRIHTWCGNKTSVVCNKSPKFQL